jgi:hypothetical protein
MARAPKATAKSPKEDAEEAAAVDAAAATLAGLSPGVKDPKAVATAIICTWIINRMRMSASKRLSGDLVFDLKNSKVRGRVEAALPQIANALGHIPPDAPLFSLSKEQIVDVFVAAINGAAHATVATMEDPDDEIPF